MMCPLIRTVVVCGWMIAAGMIAESAGYAQSASTDPSLTELPCKGDYQNNTFLSDDSVDDILMHVADVAARVPLPCTEDVGTSSVSRVNADGTKVRAAQGSLNALFDATRTPLERLQNGFDLYSWLTFVALNSPEDQKTPFGTADAQTVWESEFLPLDKVMKLREDGENDNLDHLPPTCAKAGSELKGPGKPSLFVTLDDVAFDQPFKTGPLVDQNGNYSLNTIFMNSEMRNYIFANDLRSYRGQQRFAKVIAGKPPVVSTIEFPVGQAKSARLGSMMIKASWKVMVEADDPSEFHTALAYRYFPTTRECDIRTLGLVGFHVVHKTENRHQWIWTTFEHIRNVPSLADINRGTLESAYSFYSAKADLGNHPPALPWDAGKPSSRKSQIVRAQDISADARTINQAAHDYLNKFQKNVWNHYQLISTQWPADFSCSSEGGDTKTNEMADPNCLPAPQFLPNSTLETYIQHDIGSSGGVPQSTSSCIACHNNAVAYLKIDYGDSASFKTGADPSKDKSCVDKSPKVPCSSASDFTFILEQVCAPMTDFRTGASVCKRDH